MMKSKGAVIGIFVLDIVLIAVCAYFFLSIDRTAPVISFVESDVKYSESMSDEELLLGVTARDDMDGDVTATLLVEKVTQTADGRVIVTYAAMDESNNVAKLSRTLEKKAEAEEVSVQPIVVIPETTDVPEEAEDQQEGEGDAEGEDAEGENDEEDADQARQEDQQDNNDDTQNQVGANEGQADAGRVNQAPVLHMSANTLTVTAGAIGVNWNECIAGISDDRDSTATLYGNLMLEGNVDLNTPGEYPVALFTRDSDGAESGKQWVTVKVE